MNSPLEGHFTMGPGSPLALVSQNYSLQTDLQLEHLCVPIHRNKCEWTWVRIPFSPPHLSFVPSSKLWTVPEKTLHTTAWYGSVDSFGNVDFSPCRLVPESLAAFQKENENLLACSLLCFQYLRMLRMDCETHREQIKITSVCSSFAAHLYCHLSMDLFLQLLFSTWDLVPYDCYSRCSVVAGFLVQSPLI